MKTDMKKVEKFLRDADDIEGFAKYLLVGIRSLRGWEDFVALNGEVSSLVLQIDKEHNYTVTHFGCPATAHACARTQEFMFDVSDILEGNNEYRYLVQVWREQDLMRRI
jgi:hypothetical protein